jgi:outer membrane protein OmpA-like peptidoglycan-associated protein
VLIQGHTDDIGSDQINNKLSLKRYQSVNNYFILKGIDPKRVKTIGFGKTNPLEAGKDDISRSKNRRVEIEIE